MKKLTRWILSEEDFILNYMDKYKLHQDICEIFDDGNLLFRCDYKDRKWYILIISNNDIVEKPEFGKVDTKQYDPNIRINEIYRLDVDLNAVTQKSTPEHKNPIKVPVIGEANIINWILKRQVSFGFTLENRNDMFDFYDSDETNKNYVCEIGKTQHETVIGKKERIHEIDWHNVKMNVKVVDSDLFKNMLINGIGSSKYCGLGFVKAFRIN